MVRWQKGKTLFRKTRLSSTAPTSQERVDVPSTVYILFLFAFPFPTRCRTSHSSHINCPYKQSHLSCCGGAQPILTPHNSELYTAFTHFSSTSSVTTGTSLSSPLGDWEAIQILGNGANVNDLCLVFFLFPASLPPYPANPCKPLSSREGRTNGGKGRKHPGWRPRENWLFLVIPFSL